MRHEADIQWFEELRKNLACYVSLSTVLEKDRCSDPVVPELLSVEEGKQ